VRDSEAPGVGKKKKKKTAGAYFWGLDEHPAAGYIDVNEHENGWRRYAL